MQPTGESTMEYGGKYEFAGCSQSSLLLKQEWEYLQSSPPLDMAMETIRLVGLARELIRVIIRELIPICPLVLLALDRTLIVTIVQGQIDMIIVQVGKTNARFLVLGKGYSGHVFVVIVRKPAVRSTGRMIGFERLPDLGTFLGFEFPRTSKSSNDRQSTVSSQDVPIISSRRHLPAIDVQPREYPNENGHNDANDIYRFGPGTHFASLLRE